MDKFKKFFAGKVEKLEPHLDGGDIVGEEEFQTAQDITDLDEFYQELGDHEQESPFAEQENSAYLRNFEDLLDGEQQIDDDYWQGIDDPAKNKIDTTSHETISSEVEAVADEDHMKEFDELDLSFRANSDRFKDYEHPVPEIEEVNLNTPREELKKKDQERHDNISANFRRKIKELSDKDELDAFKGELDAFKDKVAAFFPVPTNLPLESLGEVQSGVETKKSPDDELTTFKLMKDVVAYNKLVQENPNLDKLRPRRGELLLSAEQIESEMQAFKTKKEKGGEGISQLEQEYFNKCAAWAEAAKKTPRYKDVEPKNDQGFLIPARERIVLQREYFDIKHNNPKKFAQMNLEAFGNSQVEAGRWKKGEFAWTYSNFKDRDQWVCSKKENGMNIFYVTAIDPTEIAANGASAEYFYTIRTELPNKMDKTKKTVFVDVILPRTEEVVVKK